MLPDGPLEAAARRARARGTCPVWQLEDFYTDHWCFDDLCAGFGCAECVAEPEDLGPTEPWAPVAGDVPDDVPF